MGRVREMFKRFHLSGGAIFALLAISLNPGQVLAGPSEGGNLGSIVLQFRDPTIWDRVSLSEVNDAQKVNALEHLGMPLEMRLEFARIVLDPESKMAGYWMELEHEVTLMNSFYAAFPRGKFGNGEHELNAELLHQLLKTRSDLRVLFTFELVFNHLFLAAQTGRISELALIESLKFVLNEKDGGLNYVRFHDERTYAPIDSMNCEAVFSANAFSQNGDFARIREVCGFQQLGIELYLPEALETELSGLIEILN